MGKRHDCLVLIVDFTKKHCVSVDIKFHQEALCEEFPEEIKPKDKAPWNDALFKVDDDSPSLNENKLDAFHMFVVKGVFLVKRARPDLEPGFGFSSS